MTDQTSKPSTAQPDVIRRRLAKAGLAAPVVLATLASKPVLGAAPHNCTISGQVSGNVSTHMQGTCSTLGQAPSYYANQPPANWPNAGSDFLNSNGNPRLFANTPYSCSQKFANCYQKTGGGYGSGSFGPNDQASVWDVLKGYVVDSSGNHNTNVMLQVRSGCVGGLDLGQEAVAAYMNAWNIASCPNYPLKPLEVVQMFNAVVQGGNYQVASGVSWNAGDVLSYFKSLHT